MASGYASPLLHSWRNDYWRINLRWISFASGLAFPIFQLVLSDMPLYLIKVLEADSKCIEDAIRCGGLAPTKASCIKNIMRCLLEKKGKLCLEYLRHLSVDEVKAELSQFKGIGPKTVIFLPTIFSLTALYSPLVKAGKKFPLVLIYLQWLIHCSSLMEFVRLRGL